MPLQYFVLLRTDLSQVDEACLVITTIRNGSNEVFLSHHLDMVWPYQEF